MRILVLANYGMGLYNFRKELLEKLVDSNHEVYISLPYDEYVSKLEELGCKFINTYVDRRGTNPVNDFKLLLKYIKIIKSIKPDVVLTYTIKPNIYGGIACKLCGVKYLSNITGLGTSIENKGIMQKIILRLYKIGLKNSHCVFFQNKANLDFFKKMKILKGKYQLIPGSGVNLNRYNYERYPDESENVRLLFIGRIMKSKGIEELLKATEIVKSKYSNVEIDIVGGIEEDYENQIIEFVNKGYVNYYGQQNDVRPFIKKSHAIILPSYHEGLANVLLESAATGRPIIASNIPGCKETFDENISGFGFEPRSVESLVNAVIKFITLPHKNKIEMGKAARYKVENEFDRNIVVNAYLNEINQI